MNKSSTLIYHFNPLVSSSPLIFDLQELLRDDEKLKIAWLNGAFVEKNNEIYNDFESRICKNCKYFIKDKFVCCNSKAPTIVQINDVSFGCSKFERREE